AAAAGDDLLGQRALAGAPGDDRTEPRLLADPLGELREPLRLPPLERAEVAGAGMDGREPRQAVRREEGVDSSPSVAGLRQPVGGRRHRDAQMADEREELLDAVDLLRGAGRGDVLVVEEVVVLLAVASAEADAAARAAEQAV